MFFLLACAGVEIDQLDAILSGLIFSKPQLDSCLRQLFNAHCIASASRLGRFVRFGVIREPVEPAGNLAMSVMPCKRQ
jgi:hypothetical protein